MRMLDLDLKNVKNLTKITKEDALEFAGEGVAIICQTTPRDFYEIPNLLDLESIMRLEEQKIYDSLKFYIS